MIDVTGARDGIRDATAASGSGGGGRLMTTIYLRPRPRRVPLARAPLPVAPLPAPRAPVAATAAAGGAMTSVASPPAPSNTSEPDSSTDALSAKTGSGSEKWER